MIKFRYKRKDTPKDSKDSSKTTANSNEIILTKDEKVCEFSILERIEFNIK